MAGKLSYDLEKLNPYLRGLAGLDLDMRGSGEEPFTLETVWGGADRTALSATKVNASFSLDRMGFFGLRINQINVSLHIENGTAQLEINAKVNGGRFSLNPRFNLTSKPRHLSFPRPAPVRSGPSLRMPWPINYWDAYIRYSKMPRF